MRRAVSVSSTRAILISNMASGEINMASSDIITEVEIQPDIQEVEIETIPVEIPCETVETTIESDDGHGMISLQPLPEPGREEIILQTQEEIVGGDPLSVYDQIPVPDNDIYVESSPGPSRKASKKARKGGNSRFRGPDHTIFGEMGTETKTRKWEQKQVQIKTLEGEFSVTMWASGTDDGESNLKIISLLLKIAFFYHLLLDIPGSLHAFATLDMHRQTTHFRFNPINNVFSWINNQHVLMVVINIWDFSGNFHRLARLTVDVVCFDRVTPL